MNGHFRHTPTICICRSFLVRYFMEPDLFENDVPFDNTTPIYVIILLWKLWLRLWLDL